MKKIKGGFTLIEVSLFLAITGLLFLGVTIGVNNSVFQQRYNDSVQSLVEFLRTAYAETENVQGINGGRSDKAIYGKLVTFGESIDLSGGNNSDDKVFMYTVVGKAEGDLSGGDVLRSLVAREADVVTDRKLNGIVESFTPKWSSQIQVAEKGNIGKYHGSILVVRHPRSGTVYTFTMNKTTIEVNKMIKEGRNNILRDYINTSSSGAHFGTDSMNFCVNPNGAQQSNIRANVRIGSGARNAAAIETIMDGTDNKCSN